MLPFPSPPEFRDVAHDFLIAMACVVLAAAVEAGGNVAAASALAGTAALYMRRLCVRYGPRWMARVFTACAVWNLSFAAWAWLPGELKP